MSKDRESVGLTPETDRILGEIIETGWFADRQDVARFCLAYSVRNGVPEGETPGVDTRWAVGNFDKTGEIKALLLALYPDCKTPVRLMGHLVNEGLKSVGSRLKAGSISPSDLMD